MATATATRLEVGHVGLNVTDLARSTRFYREALGLDLAGESTAPGREYAFLARDGRLLLTLWRQSDGSAPTDRPGLHHLAFQVESIEQVREVEERLKALGAVIHHGGIVHLTVHRVRRGLFVRDGHVAAPAGSGEGLKQGADIRGCTPEGDVYRPEAEGPEGGILHRRG